MKLTNYIKINKWGKRELKKKTQNNHKKLIRNLKKATIKQIKEQYRLKIMKIYFKE